MSSAKLETPAIKSHEMEDPGAHELDSSEESDAFVDATEDHQSSRSGGASPIPITRVERVDDEPAYGEVPGTSAYKLRTADAVPDEVEVVPEGQRSRSASRVSRPSTPGGPQVPKIVAEKIDPDQPAYGDVPGTAAFEMRKADAEPDEIVKSPDSASAPANPFKASPTASIHRSTSLPHDEVDSDDDDDPDDDEEEDEGFGDDFDDFEEGQEADDDFGEFDEGFHAGDAAPAEIHDHPVSSPQHPPQPSIPNLNFSNLEDTESVEKACAPYLSALFSTYPPKESSDLPPPNQQIFLSERSRSLYTQLIAPPPLAPPNWLRSRIRRLFLVSLGVPVDLDEILPASKQKKLILPSIHLKSADSHSPRPSISDEARAQNNKNDPLGKLKTAHDSSASLSSTTSGRKTARRKVGGKEEPAQPEFDVAAARRLAQTTRERIDGMSDKELEVHVKEVEGLNERGREVIGYWERRVEEAGREKEAFEGVIENLIGFARKVRK